MPSTMADGGSEDDAPSPIHLLKATLTRQGLGSRGSRDRYSGIDPTHQLEVLTTDACLSLDAAETKRVKALLGFGWRLVGRDGQMLTTGDPSTNELIDRAFVPVDREIDSDLA